METGKQAETPEVLVRYLAAWRARERDQIRSSIDDCLSPDIVWCDPNYLIEGREAVVEMIVEFHKQVPDAALALTSAVDAHHGRYRYEWMVSSGDRPLIRGLDVALVGSDGLIVRIDGFFGPLVRVT